MVRIFTILLAGVLVARALFLTVQHTSLADGAERTPSAGQPSLASTSGEQFQPPARPEGESGHHSASFGQGLSGLLGTLIKVGEIVVLVASVQALLKHLSRQLAGQSPARAIPAGARKPS